MSMLRIQTRQHHENLESALQLLSPPLSQDRFRRLVQRFYGFHRVWEPAIGLHEGLRAFHHDRHRLPLLRADLALMGMDAASIDALPHCDDAVDCASDADGALGSLYVMEGSTLGGQLISRALAAESWTPAGGLRSFNPYGENTGHMWRAFKSFAERDAARRDAGKVIAGAQKTFAMLREWLPA